MRSLWHGISAGSARHAMAAFFPEEAYAQIKAFANDRADWKIRLLLDYKLDLKSAHDVVGGPAQFVGVKVPSAYAHWVAPGACVNTGGYYEVPNSRLLYRRDGQLRSIGIASMISWRGIWYVVHLGATYRVGNVGVVNDPSVGAGVAAPSSTC